MPGRTIAVVNHKGGVGKTSTSVNLAAAFGRLGLKALLIDLDPQAHATVHAGIDRASLEKSMYQVLATRTPIAEIFQPGRIPGITVAPSKIDLAVAEVDLHRIPGRDLVLREKLAGVRENFDLIVIDCPPSLGVLTWNALAAADEILIPMQAEFLALDGVANLVDVIEMVRGRLNAALKIGGLVMTMFDPRARGRMAMHVQTEDQARQFFGDKVYRTRVRRSARLTEAPSHGVSIFEHAPESSGAVDYMELAKEVLKHGEHDQAGSRIEPSGQAVRQSA